MKPKQSKTIQGSHGGFMAVDTGDHIRITTPQGSQVCDFWAFVREHTGEFLSAEHTRTTLAKLVPEKGDTLYSNLRHPLLTVMEDTSPGTHDMLMSACDPRRYVLLGHQGYHRSCAENLRNMMKEAGLPYVEIPSPFNIFQNVTVSGKGELETVPPTVTAGQYLEMRAEKDLMIIVSACPMDIAMTNGPDGKTRPILLERFSG